MTDIFEGSIIRSARRLDEFLNQLRGAANAVGEVNLENKFAAASEGLGRGIMNTTRNRKISTFRFSLDFSV
ncbi:unnamed protein product, partial [Vitis vinifera]